MMIAVYHKPQHTYISTCHDTDSELYHCRYMCIITVPLQIHICRHRRTHTNKILTGECKNTLRAYHRSLKWGIMCRSNVSECCIFWLILTWFITCSDNGFLRRWQAVEYIWGERKVKPLHHCFSLPAHARQLGNVDMLHFAFMLLRLSVSRKLFECGINNPWRRLTCWTYYTCFPFPFMFQRVIERVHAKHPLRYYILYYIIFLFLHNITFAPRSKEFYTTSLVL